MTEPALLPRKLAAGRGADWLTEGYALFRRDSLSWIGITVITLALAIASQSLNPALGLVFNLLVPVITGGLMLGCDAQQRGEPLRIDHLWSGFNGNSAGALLMLGVFGLLGLLLVALGVVIAIGASLGSALLAGGGLESLELGASALLALLAALLIMSPITMALWFAPALVAIQGLTPVAALKASFRGCLANIGPLTVNGLLMIVIAVVATIPFGLGWLVALPVITASIYFGYRDIFSSGIPVPGQGQ